MPGGGGSSRIGRARRRTRPAPALPSPDRDHAGWHGPSRRTARPSPSRRRVPRPAGGWRPPTGADGAGPSPRQDRRSATVSVGDPHPRAPVARGRPTHLAGSARASAALCAAVRPPLPGRRRAERHPRWPGGSPRSAPSPPRAGSRQSPRERIEHPGPPLSRSSGPARKRGVACPCRTISPPIAGHGPRLY